jgi:hypothetical protein
MNWLIVDSLALTEWMAFIVVGIYCDMVRLRRAAARGHTEVPPHPPRT